MSAPGATGLFYELTRNQTRYDSALTHRETAALLAGLAPETPLI